MKKFLVAILALLYISTSTGATLHMHYCMGKLADWGFSHNKDEDCSNCGMKETESKGCCKDEQKFLKIDKEQKTADASFQIPPLTWAAAIHPCFELTSVYVPSLMEEHPLSNAPPRWQSLPLFIRNCVFRI